MAPERAGPAGAELAAQIRDRRVLKFPALDERVPVLATLTHDDINVSTIMDRRGDLSVSEPTIQDPDSSLGTGFGTLAAALALGLAGFLVVLMAAFGRSTRGSHARRAMKAFAGSVRHGVGERGVPDEQRKVPRTEVRRIRVDAWQDLNAAFGSAPTARAKAEDAAWQERAAAQSSCRPRGGEA